MTPLRVSQMSGRPRRTGRWFSVVLLLCFCALGQAPAVIGQDDEVNQDISQLLKDANPYGRIGAAGALGRLGDSRAVEPLIAALKDPNTDVRYTAVEALGKIKDPRAFQPLMAALNDSKGEVGKVRAATVLALGEINDPRAFEPLMAALNDSEGEVRAAVVQTLRKNGKIKDLALQLLIKHMDDPWVSKEIIPAVADFGSSAVEPLLATLRPEFSIRDYAIAALVRIGRPGVGLMVTALKDPNKNVRRSVIEALGKINDPRAIEPLIFALKDSDSEVRILAAEALGNILNFTAYMNMLASTKEDSPTVPVVAALKNANPYLRLGAVDALGRLREPDSKTIDAMAIALKDADWRVRVIAAWALGHTTPGTAALESQKPADPSLQSIAADYKSWIRKARPGSADVLIRALNAYGNKEMAQDYFNVRSVPPFVGARFVRGCAQMDKFARLYDNPHLWGSLKMAYNGAALNRKGLWRTALSVVACLWNILLHSVFTWTRSYRSLFLALHFRACFLLRGFEKLCGQGVLVALLIGGMFCALPSSDLVCRRSPISIPPEW